MYALVLEILCVTTAELATVNFCTSVLGQQGGTFTISCKSCEDVRQYAGWDAITVIKTGIA